MTRRQQLLYFIAADDGPTDPLRTMKALFVFARRVAEGPVFAAETFDFSPMSYGPCSSDVYRLLDQLVEEEFLEELPVPGETWKRYRATQTGRAEARQAEHVSGLRNACQLLRELRDWTDQQSFNALLRSVYHAYPEYAANSVLPHLRPNG